MGRRSGSLVQRATSRHPRSTAICFLVILSAIFLLTPHIATGQSCCSSYTGNVDCDPTDNVDIADLTALIDYMFVSYTPLCCIEAANCDGDPDNGVDIADLTAMIDYLFVSLSPLPRCVDPISQGRRDTILTESGSYFATLKHAMSKMDAATAMAEHLKTVPEITDAGVADDGNVWARFTDDRLMIFVNNIEIPQGQRVDSVDLGARLRSVSQALSGPTNVPGTNKLRISDALDPALFNAVGGRASYIAENVGYKWEFIGSVQSLKTQVADVGLFYVGGHGGYGNLRNNATEYAIWTSDKFSNEKDSVFADDLREHRLVYMFALWRCDSLGNDINEWRYAFTGQFVRAYMSFASNSLVLVHGCSSATNNAFVNAFLTKGASLFAGYTNTVFADFAAQASTLFLDRLTGANWYATTRENPYQRAFAWPAVLSWMQSQHYDYGDQNGTAKLIAVTASGNDNPVGPLAPSIATMFVHPYDKELTLWGIFGDNPGSDGVVLVDNVPLPVKSWSYDGTVGMDKVVCTIEDDGAGSYGTVQVKIREIESNKTQLSRYKGRFTLTHMTGDGRQYDIKLNLQFRVHLLPFRMQPGEAPTFNQSTYVVHADMSSTGRDSCSGTTFLPDGTTVSWMGADSLTNNIGGAEAEKSFISGAWFDPENMKLQLYLSGGVRDGITQLIHNPQGATYSIPQTIVYGLDTLDGIHPNFPSYVEIPLNENYSIGTGSRTTSKVGMGYSFTYPYTDQVTIKWDDIACDAPPDSLAPR